MNILVLGGAGFMGSNLAIHLNNLGHKITVMDNMVRNGVENNLPRFKKYDIEFVRGDIRCPEDFNKLRGNFDIVLLLAAQPAAINYANPVFDITNNTMGVLHTLEYIRNSGAGLIFWSTNKCYSGQVCNTVPYVESDSRYVWANRNHIHTGWSEIGFNENLSIDGKDRSIYGVSKAMADVLIQEWSDSYGIPSIINRFSCLSGDTSIKTDMGDFKLKDIVNNSNVLTNNGFNKTSTGAFKNGIKKVYNITTKGGFSIKSTDDHRFYTPSGYRQIKDIDYGSYVEILPNHQSRVPVTNLPDAVVISEQNYIDFLSNEKFNFSTSFINRAVSTLKSKNLLPLKFNNPNIYKIIKLVGYCFGDAHIRQANFVRPDNKKNATTITCQIYDKDDENLNLIKNEIESLGFYCSDINTQELTSLRPNGQIISGTSKKISISSVPFNALLVLLGVPTGKKASKEFLVPEYIMSAHCDIKAAFLSGLMGSDGTTPNVVLRTRKGKERYELRQISFTQCKNEQYHDNAVSFLNQLSQLFLEFDIPTTQNIGFPYENKDGSISKAYELRISSGKQNYINFSKIGYAYNKQRQRNLSFICEFIKTNLNIQYYNSWIFRRTKMTSSPDMMWDQVLSKDLIGEEEVYDMTVPELSHFIANQFHVHNCVSGPYQWGIAEQGWVTWFAIANILDLPIEVYGFKGKQVRDNLNIKDLCSLIEKQIANIQKYRGEVFNVGGGINNTMSLIESFGMIEELTSKKFNNISFLEEPRRADQIIYMSDITKVSKEFNWSPQVSPKEGYVDIIEWVNENKKILEGLYK